MSAKSFKYILLAAPFLLGACGEGYEQIRTSEIFPYGNQRTAGSTIAYVQAKLMPERTLNLDSVSDQKEQKANVTAPAPPPSNVIKELENDLETLFEEKQKK